MKFNQVINEATRIISVDMSTGAIRNANPKAAPGTNKVVHMDKKRMVPQVFDKSQMKTMDYYVPDLPPGAWESLPPAWRKFYKDTFNSYPEVTFQPYTTMAKYYNVMKRLEKKYPKIPWRKLFPMRPDAKKAEPVSKVGLF